MGFKCSRPSPVWIVDPVTDSAAEDFADPVTSVAPNISWRVGVAVGEDSHH